MQPVKLTPLQANADGRSWLQDVIYRPSDSLRLVVVGSSDRIKGLRFQFRFEASSLRGFLLLDEGDLITIWEPSHYIPNGSMVYEVVQGSIFETLSHMAGVLSVSMPWESLDGLHEYLIATDDDCILVLSSQPPHFEELFQDDSK